MSSEHNTSDQIPLQVSVEMFLAVTRGRATAKERDLVHQALADPGSDLNRWLKAAESWADNALTTTMVTKAAGTTRSARSARKQSEAVVVFVYRLRCKDKLTDHEVADILSAGAADSSMRSAREDNRAASHMLQRLTELRPQLSSEVRRWTTQRSPFG